MHTGRVRRTSILACLTMASLVATPLMAQQDGAPELTAEASQAINKGLRYLLSTQKQHGNSNHRQNYDQYLPA